MNKFIALLAVLLMVTCTTAYAQEYFAGDIEQRGWGANKQDACADANDNARRSNNEPKDGNTSCVKCEEEYRSPYQNYVNPPKWECVLIVKMLQKKEYRLSFPD